MLSKSQIQKVTDIWRDARPITNFVTEDRLIERHPDHIFLDYGETFPVEHLTDVDGNRICETPLSDIVTDAEGAPVNEADLNRWGREARYERKHEPHDACEKKAWKFAEEYGFRQNHNAEFPIAHMQMRGMAGAPACKVPGELLRDAEGNIPKISFDNLRR